MLKKTALALVVIVGIGLSVLMFQGNLHVLRQVWPSKPAPPKVPSKPPSNTLVIFNLRPSGDKDAVYYAVGFSRALSDWFHSGSKTAVMQPSTSDLGRCLEAMKCGKGYSVSDEQAKEAAKRLGCRYAITGDLKLRGQKVYVELHLLDVASNKQPVMTSHQTGDLVHLPSFQTSVVEGIMRAVVGYREGTPMPADKPSFRKPETLVLYGKSYLSKSETERTALRWKMWQGEPDSYFATLRALERSLHSRMMPREIGADRRIRELVASSARTFPDNALVGVLRGDLLLKQCRYHAAQDLLQSVVQKHPHDPDAKAALAYIAICRSESKTAVDAAERSVRLWPTCPAYRDFLARAYSLAAENARRDHDNSELSLSARTAWRRDLDRALGEARVAVAIDPDYHSGWATIFDICRQRRKKDDMDAAYRQMIRIHPRDMDAYKDYAYMLSPRWGGDASKQAKVLDKAERVFGKDSLEMCIINGWAAPSGSSSADISRNRLRLAETVLGKTKDPMLRLAAMQLKLTALNDLKRRDEALKLAEEAFDLCPSLYWRIELARVYQYRWQDAHDRAALDKAAELYRVYVEEAPSIPSGHIQYGWCLSHQGKRAAAKREFLTALKLDPGNKLALEKLQYVQ